MWEKYFQNKQSMNIILLLGRGIADGLQLRKASAVSRNISIRFPSVKLSCSE
jgi:hypothetical protein